MTEQHILVETQQQDQLLEQVRQLCTMSHTQVESMLKMGELYQKLLNLDYRYSDIAELAERSFGTAIPLHATLMRYAQMHQLYVSDLNIPIAVVAQQGIGKLTTLAKHDPKLADTKENPVTDTNREALATHALKCFERDLSEFKKDFHLDAGKNIKLGQGTYEHANLARERLGKVTGDGISFDTFIEFTSQIVSGLPEDQLKNLWQQTTGDEV